MLNYLFVEGTDDEVFFDYIKPIENCPLPLDTRIITYAQQKNQKIKGLIRTYSSLKNQGMSKFLFLGDADFYEISEIDNEENIRKRKGELADRYDVEIDAISLVIIKIENWYYAGLTADKCRDIGITILNSPYQANKQFYHNEAQKLNLTVRQLKQIILENYDLESALDQNSSMTEFIEKTEIVFNHN